MLKNRATRLLALCLTSVWLLSGQAPEQTLSKHVFFRVQAAASVPEALNGRLLIFVKKGAGDKTVDLNEFRPTMSSFDWVFSPKSDSGAPEQMFDRKTGAVNARVVAYWHDHYDLAHIVESNWAARGADLKGRIHLIVGTADTFYLDGSAHKFEAVLNRLGTDQHFSYLPDKTHMDLYTVGGDRMALFDRISAEMYAVARPVSAKP